MTRLSLIVAMDENRLIGSDNGLPWQLPADLQFFKRTTMGKPIIMGRKTFQSIGRALPGRRNIVVTRDPEFVAEGCETAPSLDAALTLVREEPEAMLIGGATLYRQAIERADCLYLTRIHHAFNGDTWFPEFDEAEWREENRQNFEADHGNPWPYSFIKFIKDI